MKLTHNRAQLSVTHCSIKTKTNARYYSFSLYLNQACICIKYVLVTQPLSQMLVTVCLCTHVVCFSPLSSFVNDPYNKRGRMLR